MKTPKGLLALFSNTRVWAPSAEQALLAPVKCSLCYVVALSMAYVLALFTVVLSLGRQPLTFVFLLLLVVFAVQSYRKVNAMRSIRLLGYDGRFFIVMHGGNKFYADVLGEVFLVANLLAFELVAEIDGRRKRWSLILHNSCMHHEDFRILRRIFSLSPR